MATKIVDSDSGSSLKNLIPHMRGVDQDGTAVGLQQGWDVGLMKIDLTAQVENYLA